MRWNRRENWLFGVGAAGVATILITGNGDAHQFVTALSSTPFHLAAQSILPPDTLYIKGSIWNAVHNSGNVNLFIRFRPLNLSTISTNTASFNVYSGLQEFTPPNPHFTRAQKRQAVYDALTRHAHRSQATTRQELTRAGLRHRSFWINNSLVVWDVNPTILHLLIMLATNGEEMISLEPYTGIVAKLPPFPRFDEEVKRHDGNVDKFKQSYINLGSSNSQENDTPWNVRLIKANQVWSRTRGEGVVVANIDTGVNYRHSLLKDAYRGNKQQSHTYNWYDPMGVNNHRPIDIHGHGSHTMGIMVRVAPRVQWIAAQGCDEHGCSQERLLAAAQWVMCPTDNFGKEARCDLGADVINNSWGGSIIDAEEETSMTWFSGAVQAWLAADLIPIFAQGNEGPACGTAGTPGDLAAVLAVGSVDRQGALSFFSSRGPGPAKFGHSPFKPDYVAPGEEIWSCSKTGDELVPMSGTSMAAPHVAGMTALLLSLRPHLALDELREIMNQSANQGDLTTPQLGQMQCHGVPWDRFPNFQYGQGLINVAGAMALLGV